MKLYNAIQKNFYIQDSGYYREEALGARTDNPISFLWPLCALVQADNEMDATFKKVNYLPSILAVISKYEDSRPPVSGFASYKLGNKVSDRFYDDNQWIGIAAFDAYKRTNNKEYLQLGKSIYHFMMSGYDTIAGGGIYWVEANKESKNTCSNGPGVLIALRMYEYSINKKYLDTAILIYDWTKKNLRSPDGLYYDNYNVKKHNVDSACYSYNSGTMLESSVWLYTVTGNRRYLEEAMLTAQNSAKYFLSGDSFKDGYWFNAVLLRGYIRLFELNHDDTYIKLFRKCLDYTIANERHENGLFGKMKVDNLVGQGGLLEILCRFIVLQK